MTITAILPAFNEEVSIGSMVLHAKQHADKVVVIDDGSKDRTAELAKLAGAEVIRHPRNLGKGRSLKTAFDHIAKNGSNIIITMDSDGQHNPEDIQKLVAPILAGEADIVNGSRYLNGKDKNTPFYRRIGQYVLDRATNLNSGLHITDTQSGFRAFARHTLPAFRFRSNGLAIESEMLMDAANAGYRIKEVEIGVRYDVDGSSENPVSHGLKVLANVINDMELNRPLYYFTLPGAILGIIGLAMGLSFLQNFYNGGSLNYGPTLLMILLTLIGTFMVFTGIILHTMSKLIIENKKKVDQTLNQDKNTRAVAKHGYFKQDSFENPWV
ncbi:MAG: glycosyltransferase family 2 protein [Candidatus Methanoperedens sp.]|nr:glycosyltransferase family 2 protein [Candidatus Methanoperedens sp.]